MKAKEIFNQQAISQTNGISYDYNEAVGKSSINSPNRVSARERGIPHVLKGVDKPLFRKSIAEPFNKALIIIQEEMRTKDRLAINAMSNKSVFEVPVKVVLTTETVLDTDKLEQKDNMHGMPKIDISHKACGVANCMSCAFNIMYAYFNSKHASRDKTAPHQHMNNKMHVRAKTIFVKNLNNGKHAKVKGIFPQQMNQDIKVKSKTVSPPKARMETSVPKPKQKKFKAVYKVKCSVSEKPDSVKTDNTILSYKGQFFKYVGPNKVWVPKKV